MEKQTLQAEVRDSSGKGPARQLRMSGKIPAVFYGPGVETTKLTISPKELLKALSTEYRRNTLLSLNVGGKDELAMVKEIQVHPISRDPLHVDLLKVDEERPVTVKVPVKTKGRAVGVQKGGKLRVVFRELPVRCRPIDIPAAIEVDVAKLDLNDVLMVKDISLPEGSEVLMGPDRRVITVAEGRKGKGQAATEESD